MRWRSASARALVKMNAEWTSAMRKAGLLTRDARVKERKKPGLKRAPQSPDLHQALGRFGQVACA